MSIKLKPFFLFAFIDETPKEKRKTKKQKVVVEVDKGTHQDRIK